MVRVVGGGEGTRVPGAERGVLSARGGFKRRKWEEMVGQSEHTE